MAAVVFGTGLREQVVETIGRQDPPNQFVPFSVSDFINYLSKTTWPVAWEWAVQIDHLLQTMARERVLMEMTSGVEKSPVFSRRYLLMSGLSRGQASGNFWMTPVLGVPLLLDVVQNALIHLTGLNSTGDVRAGTGLVLGPGYILTARHVITDMNLDGTLVVPKQGGGAAEVSVVAETAHPEHDLAVITTDVNQAELVPASGLVTRDPSWSDTIYLLGYPPVPLTRSAETTVQTGEIVNPAIQTYEGAQLFLYSAVARPGNSGGPIFGRDGRFLGMVTRELSHQNADATPPSFYAGLPSRVIHACLEDLGLNELLVAEDWK
jgi:S1-C subfamily serine protease